MKANKLLMALAGCCISVPVFAGSRAADAFAGYRVGEQATTVAQQHAQAQAIARAATEELYHFNRVGPKAVVDVSRWLQSPTIQPGRYAEATAVVERTHLFSAQTYRPIGQVYSSDYRRGVSTGQLYRPNNWGWQGDRGDRTIVIFGSTSVGYHHEYGWRHDWRRFGHRRFDDDRGCDWRGGVIHWRRYDRFHGYDRGYHDGGFHIIIGVRIHN